MAHIPWWTPYIISVFVLLIAVVVKIYQVLWVLLKNRQGYRRASYSQYVAPIIPVTPSLLHLDMTYRNRKYKESAVSRAFSKLDLDSSEDEVASVISAPCKTHFIVEKTASDKVNISRAKSFIVEPTVNRRRLAYRHPTIFQPRSEFTHKTPKGLPYFLKWIRQWFNQRHLVLSSRQKLMIKVYCERYTTVSYPSGIITFTVYTALCTCSWILYIMETFEYPPASAHGISYTLTMRIFAWLHFPINLFCLGYYILRLCAATDRAAFVLSYPSLIDVLSIPSSMIAVMEQYRHFDLNFIRAACIFNYVDVLTYWGVIKSNRSINSARICFALVTLWMFGSGLMHGIEHLGDFWHEGSEPGSWSYLEACYFLLVTLSTVGYGDYVAHTTMGKLFICIFIPLAMGVSASFLPELFRDLKQATYISDRYQSIRGENHVLVCGNFDNGSLQAFIRAFLSGGRAKGRSRLNMVILRPHPIDLALKAILSHFHAWVRYFVGTPNNPQDLVRTRMNDARAAIILATPNTRQADAEDGANIMQAIALKARKKTLRVVLQLHSFRNKCLINNFPRWTHLFNDMVVCMEELKLGLMAYNCLAPGFACLVLNLLNIYGSERQVSKYSEKWREEYEYGFRMELHEVGISYEFDKVTMKEFTAYVYQRWHMILVAVLNEDKSTILVNPSDYSYLINASRMKAIVISKNYNEALQIQMFCTNCLSHRYGHRCRCPKPARMSRKQLTIERDLALYEQIDQSGRAEFRSTESEHLAHSPISYRHSITTMNPSSALDRKRLHFMTNKQTTLDEMCIMDDGAVRKHGSVRQTGLSPVDIEKLKQMQNTDWHITDYKVDRTGSFHWVSDVPLCNATLTPEQAKGYKFKGHILVCVVGTPEGGSWNLENFIMPLRFHWQSIRDIVILGNSEAMGENEWIKLKNLPRIFIVKGDPCSFTDLHAVQLCSCGACVILGHNAEHSELHSVDVSLQDRKTLFCAMNIRSLLQSEQQPVHLTTELCYEKNAHLFSTVETHANDFHLPVWFHEPFASGFIFSKSLLYSCISSLFYNDGVFQFLRVLISGQSADEIEATFAVGGGLQPAPSQQTYRISGVNVALRGFNQPPFRFIAKELRKKPLRFGEVVDRCITCYQVLCLGIYRLESRGFRYVLANPAPDTILHAHDMFYCFMPTHQTDEPGSWKHEITQLELCRSESP